MLQPLLPILPISDLRMQAKDILNQVRKQPVVITQSGRPSAVIINYQAYNDLVSQLAQLESYRQVERVGWSLLSEESLKRVWDNPADAAYDNWKELYDI